MRTSKMRRVARGRYTLAMSLKIFITVTPVVPRIAVLQGLMFTYVEEVMELRHHLVHLGASLERFNSKGAIQAEDRATDLRQLLLRIISKESTLLRYDLVEPQQLLAQLDPPPTLDRVGIWRSTEIVIQAGNLVARGLLGKF